jgi:Domain of unknown function (DUF4193)
MTKTKKNGPEDRTMEDNTDEMTEDEELEPTDDDDGDEGDAPEPAATTPATDGEGGTEGVESSLEELLAKREGRPAEEEEEDDSMLAIGRDERLEPLAVKVVPPTDKEFVCRNCHLVKHRSQLADRDRMFCRDCA